MQNSRAEFEVEINSVVGEIVWIPLDEIPWLRSILMKASTSLFPSKLDARENADYETNGPYSLPEIAVPSHAQHIFPKINLRRQKRKFKNHEWFFVSGLDK